ncbi:MAG: acyl carrier protein [Alteromonadaceae bacterium]|jgi:acyl carrier protein|uniref:acyl carrier protein n=1 Tax=Paraglaciecola chathamensis TaxID=368405 RepID=UPI000C57826B|nr:acyl carrier protein [Paraglaciecola agarilytica]MBN27146.1 acyl carrier protein [Alteromonadaceae bacterium]|tara:strand:- start:1907 stop:2155 length:249 start_codon:yes stop_codon:yes gene_type:complete
MNKTDETYQKVVNLFEELFEIDPATIKPESKLYEDLDIDSIDAVDLVVELRKMTGIKIKPEDFKTVRTVNDVVVQVDNLLAE